MSSGILQKSNYCTTEAFEDPLAVAVGSAAYART